MAVINKKAAFTLAEVLITLAIIGVVAAMTIPALINNVQDRDTVTLLKKAYSNFSQAYQLAVLNNGSPDTWGTTITDAFNVLRPYLKIMNDCGQDSSGNTHCWANELYTLSGTPYLNMNKYGYYKAVLADGSSIGLEINQSTCVAGNNACGLLRIDVNGQKGPNKMGVDTFFFQIGPNKIAPIGVMQGNLASAGSDVDHNLFNCDLSDTAGQHNGIGCTTWVIYNENLDYLHCNDLNWQTKTKCK